MKQKPSPELVVYFELCRGIYERKVADGTWDQAIAEIRKKSEEFDSSHGSESHETERRLS